MPHTIHGTNGAAGCIESDCVEIAVPDVPTITIKYDRPIRLVIDAPRIDVEGNDPHTIH